MQFDLSVIEMQHNPYPTYAKMRQTSDAVIIPHTMTGRDSYFFTRYEDVMAILQDSRFINDESRLPDADDWTKKWYIPSAMKYFAHSLALKDEPDHGRLKQLIHKAFTPRMIQSMNDRIEVITANMLEQMENKSEIDLINEFALPIPLNVISDMMGIAQHQRASFARWLDNSVSNLTGKDGLRIIPKLLNTIQLGRFLQQLVKDRRKNPKNDLTTALVQAEDNGEHLSHDELMGMLFLILFAGHETTVNLIGSGVLALLQYPEQFERLKSNPDLIDSAIEELLRYTNPVQHIAQRYNVETIQVGTVTIPAHSTVYLGIAAANRDENVFDNPDHLDITRTPNKHIAFGFGVHYCLGAPLARMEAKIAFTRLFEQYPNMQLAIDENQLEWKGAPALRGLKQLPIKLNQ